MNIHFFRELLSFNEMPQAHSKLVWGSLKNRLNSPYFRIVIIIFATIWRKFALIHQNIVQKSIQHLLILECFLPLLPQYGISWFSIGQRIVEKSIKCWQVWKFIPIFAPNLLYVPTYLLHSLKFSGHSPLLHEQRITLILRFYYFVMLGHVYC